MKMHDQDDWVLISNEVDSLPRQDVAFVNSLLHEMNIWHPNYPESSAYVNLPIDFAKFLYENLGMPFSRAYSESKSFNRFDDTTGKPILLRLFSIYPGNPETEFTLACPDSSISPLSISSIKSKFDYLWPYPARNGTTVEDGLAEIIIIYLQTNALLLREPVIERRIPGLNLDMTLLIVRTLEQQLNTAYEKMLNHLNGAESTYNVLTTSLKALRVASRGLFFNSNPNRKRLSLLLECVYMGNLNKVEDMLNITPELLSSCIAMRDLSGRDFSSITPLQYAAWSLDWPMVDLIKSYLLSSQIKEQLDSLNDPNGCIAKEHGSHFSIRKYVDDAFDCPKYEFGGQLVAIDYDSKYVLRQFPAWLVMLICQKKEPFQPYNTIPCGRSQFWKSSKIFKRDQIYLACWYDFMTGNDRAKLFSLGSYNLEHLCSIDVIKSLRYLKSIEDYYFEFSYGYRRRNPQEISVKHLEARQDVIFVNSFLQEIKIRKVSNPEVVKKMRHFAKFLYQHLGLEASVADRQVKGSNKVIKLFNRERIEPIVLKKFSVFPNHQSNLLILPCPDNKIEQALFCKFQITLSQN